MFLIKKDIRCPILNDIQLKKAIDWKKIHKDKMF